MIRRLGGLLTLSGLVLLSAVATTTAADVHSRELLDRRLATIRGADRGQVVPVVDDALSRAFPADAFYALRFRQYPVATAPPEPLQANNLFAVRANGTVLHLVGVHGLEVFFKTSLRRVASDEEAKEAAKAWLRLVEELHQDGFLQFFMPDDALQVVLLPTGQRKVTGKAQISPQGGDQGDITVSLTFGVTGQLLAASESASIKRGLRPICQATKLLDPDPIVRKMAEQDLLVMGKAAKEYLDEQRARARPALRQAIDRIWQRILIADR